MRYPNITKGIFIDRPNRFIARVEIAGREEICHVKNTGRCRELLKPGARVLLSEGTNPNRKTKYDLVSVYKGDRLVNMDSQAPNAMAFEWLSEGNYFRHLEALSREKTYGSSRFDLWGREDGRPFYMEVKGVTLETDGIARFPDAPTQRGVKHIRELAAASREGLGAYLLFVIQMKGVSRLEPNWDTHREFGTALMKAERDGVMILAYDCLVRPGEVKIEKPVPIRLCAPPLS